MREGTRLLVEENREELEAVAESSLPASPIASAILELAE